MKKRRLKIPDDIRLKLWVRSGGRCEFPGCNELVWRDGLTLKEDNFAHVAHIVAASPDGPRGHATKSKKLQITYENLTLVCLKHSKLIDGRHKKSYTEEQLREYKVKHEDRIQRQTAIGPDLATTVVRFIANIGDRRVDVSLPQAYEATAPRFPADDKGVLLDFSNKPGRGNQKYWQGFAKEITEQVKRDFVTGNNRQRYEHLSVFAMGPMHLLMHFGSQIGNIVPADLYQKHRGTDDWKWQPELRRDQFVYRLTRTKEAHVAKRVALILSLSGKVHTNEFRKVLPNATAYEISIDQPDTGFLIYRSRLNKFRTVYRQVLTEIRTRYGDKCEICMFPCVPAPIAVLCGKELLPKSDPSVTIYDNDKQKGGFVPTIKIN